MGRIGFDKEKYLEMQSTHILERINSGDGQRLYLEFGGKLVHDKHAARVLPGFDENAKIKLLHKMKEHAEIVICIYSGDIAPNKTRQDIGITYDLEVLRLIDTFRTYELPINSVVITRYQQQPSVDMFINKLKQRDIKTYTHQYTKGYPTDVETIVSDEGYGANPRIEVTKPLVVVTGPGGGSGKLATCLSQLYHDQKEGVKARYAKFETFPIWNVPLKHPVNVAYEAATADLKDVNMIDSFHLDEYGTVAVNYNRDLEIFPVMTRIIEKITGSEAEYKSPTDMGVNMAGYGISDDDVCRHAAEQEIIRRFLIGRCDYKKGKISEETLERCKLLMDDLSIDENDRAVVKPARDYVASYMEKKGKADICENSDGKNESVVAMAIELHDGTFVTGRSSNEMVAAAAAVLNAVKILAGIDDKNNLISPTSLVALQNLRKEVLGQEKVTLNCEEVLNGLAISATGDDISKKALEKLTSLHGCRAHCTAILSDKDEQILGSLGLDLTCDPEYVTTNLYFG